MWNTWEQYSLSFLISITKYLENSSAVQEKDESFCAEQNNSSSSAAPTTDCLATTQGGDLNRQPDWKRSKTGTSGDTPMVPFVTKRIIRFAFLYFITSGQGCQGEETNNLQEVCWRVQKNRRFRGKREKRSNNTGIITGWNAKMQDLCTFDGKRKPPESICSPEGGIRLLVFYALGEILILLSSELLSLCKQLFCTLGEALCQ